MDLVFLNLDGGILSGSMKARFDAGQGITIRVT